MADCGIIFDRMNDSDGAVRSREALYTDRVRCRLAAPIRGGLEALTRRNGRTLSEEMRAALAAHVVKMQKE